MSTPAGGYFIETLDDAQVFSVLPQAEGQPIEVLIPPSSKIMEVPSHLPDTHYHIGPNAPTRPDVNVWYDTKGA